MQAWQPPPERSFLPADEVHVWRAALDLPHADLERLADALTAEEKQRAARFLKDEHRRHFIAARGLLRRILGGYRAVPAASIRFTYGLHGKPALTGTDEEPLYFNVSHSSGMALYAMTRIGEIGVDIERERHFADAEGLAERFFSPRERQLMRAAAPAQKMAAFFNAWTRKEAWLKAFGTGISFGLDRVEVTLLPGDEARLLSIDDDVEQASAWTLWGLTPADGYVAAVALFGKDVTFKCRYFSW